MGSVFRRLIQKEFGKRKYETYFAWMEKNLIHRRGKEHEENKAVYYDIYHVLEKKDIATVSGMHDRLNAALLKTLQISRTYLGFAIMYAAAMIVIVAKQLMPVVAIGSAVLLTAIFAVKTYEYLVNKYCYIDAQIVLEYKSAMENLLLAEVEVRKSR